MLRERPVPVSYSIFVADLKQYHIISKILMSVQPIMETVLKCVPTLLEVSYAHVWLVIN